MKLMINLIRPEFMIPIHGELRHLKQHAEIAKELGIPDENIAVVENGTPLELTAVTLDILPRMKGGYVFVDGASVGDIGWSVVRERDQLSQNGFFFASVNSNDRGDVIGKPEFVSRGFTNLKEAEDLMEGAEETIARVVKMVAENKQKNLTKQLEDALSRYFYAETGRRPLVHVIVH